MNTRLLKGIGVAAACMLGGFSMTMPVALAQPVETAAAHDKAWRTHYFGRFQLDLPIDSEVLADYKLYNENVELISQKGKAEINTLVGTYIEELNKGIARGTNSNYERTIELSNGSLLVVSRLKEFYTLRAYLLTSHDTLYQLGTRAISAKGLEGAIKKLAGVSESVFFRDPQEAPPPGTFALESGYSTLGSTQSIEGIFMGAQIAAHPGTFVSLLTQRIVEHEESLIERFDNPTGNLFTNGLFKLTNGTRTLRKRERMIGDIPVEEVAIKAKVDGKLFYTFQVEYKGTLKSNTRPAIELELGTHEVGSDFKSDEEALMFWDRVVESLKPLP